MSELSAIFATLAPAVQDGIRDLGWSEPTPVQAKVLPPMTEGRDLIVQAHTGSGKTGAFGIPIVASLASLNEALNPAGDRFVRGG